MPPRVSLLDTDVMSEFAQVLTVGTLAILGIFFGTVEFKNMLALVSQFGVPVKAILSIWLLQIPTGAMYALPAGMMLSTMIVIMRKQRDSELVALRTLGVSRMRLAQPFLLLGLICSLASYGIGEFVAPQARHLSSKLLLLEACRSARPFPQMSKIEIQGPDEKLAQIMILGQAAGHTINGFLLFNLTKDGVVSLTWSQIAERVRGDWQLRDGHLFELFSDDHNGHKGFFGSMTIPAASQLWKRLEDSPSNPLELTTEQLRKQIEKLRATGKPVPGELLVQYYRRSSQPLSCLLLVMAALPVAFVGGRRDIKLPLAYGALMVPGYFIMQQIFLSLGETNLLNPLVAAWAPAVILCLVAFLFSRVTAASTC